MKLREISLLILFFLIHDGGVFASSTECAQPHKEDLPTPCDEFVKLLNDETGTSTNTDGQKFKNAENSFVGKLPKIYQALQTPDCDPKTSQQAAKKLLGKELQTDGEDRSAADAALRTMLTSFMQQMSDQLSSRSFFAKVTGKNTCVKPNLPLLAQRNCSAYAAGGESNSCVTSLMGVGVVEKSLKRISRGAACLFALHDTPPADKAHRAQGTRNDPQPPTFKFEKDPKSNNYVFKLEARHVKDVPKETKVSPAVVCALMRENLVDRETMTLREKPVLRRVNAETPMNVQGSSPKGIPNAASIPGQIPGID